MIHLEGTLPVRPYHPDGFVGHLEADGQQVKVAALACCGEHVVMLSLVGFDTSIGVMLSMLWSNRAVPFTPAFAWQDEWQGPLILKRDGSPYKQTIARLEGTREVHALALLKAAHIAEGIQHPPELPEPPKEPPESQEPPPASETGATAVRTGHTPTVPPAPHPPVWLPRYLFGNGDEETPNRRSFQGHLAALRIPILYRHTEHPQWPDSWADALWEHGLAAHLITALPALGLCCWQLSGDLTAWATLVGNGVREGWLPWR
jgi:hypothetical protein